MPNNPDQRTLDAIDEAFSLTVQKSFETLWLGLIDSQGNEAKPIARFEGAIKNAKRARELALASAGKLIA